MTQVARGWMWGDEPLSWFQVDAIVDVVIAAATLATLIWAVVTTLRAEKRAENAENREREREQAAERAQASRVTVYKDRSAPIEGLGGWAPTILWVNNASDQPIFSVTVHGTVPESDGMTTMRSRRRPSVPPGSAQQFQLNAPEDGLLTEDGSLLSADAVAWVAVDFRDANGVDWLRTETGRLTRMPDDADAAMRLLTEHLAEQWTVEARTEYAKKITKRAE